MKIMKTKPQIKTISRVSRAARESLGSGRRNRGGRARHLPTHPSLLILLVCLALETGGCAIYRGGQELVAVYPGFGFSILPSVGPHSLGMLPVPMATPSENKTGQR